MTDFIRPPADASTSGEVLSLAGEVHAMRDEVISMRTAHKIGAMLVAALLTSVLGLGSWLVATTLRNEASISHLTERLDGQTQLTSAVGELHSDVRVLTREVQHVRAGQTGQEEEIRGIRARIDEFAQRRSR